ncbi:MAG: cobyrinate a,c-diamide synthase [Gammaproteobacteria bacterium]|nr:cobyrinate a,c-diamide synthase [Gammaproteobacteria bacterium]
MSRPLPALLITAPASGQGKTTVTAALARYFSGRGQRVAVFKIGPDFIDAMLLEAASGLPVYQLDLWMVGEAGCRTLLYKAAKQADMILLEGVMGLFDGNPSSADLAKRFGLPLLLVIDASSMAQSFAAVATGLANFDPQLRIAGVVANRIGSDNHLQMVREKLPQTLPFYGGIKRDAAFVWPSRHLGLYQAAEIADLPQRLDSAAAAMAATLAALPLPEVTFDQGVEEPLPPLLAGVTIAIARDAAFSFLYRANLELLVALGATLCDFSPLADSELPACDALYFPGGYPELHLAALAANTSLHQAIREHHRAAKPIVAECGGMLYLLQSLTAKEERAALVGLLPAAATMQKGVAGLGMHSVTLPLPQPQTFRGHTFHHSSLTQAPQPLTLSTPQRQGGKPEAVYTLGSLIASYLHLYFPSNPEATAALFRGAFFHH